MIGFEAIWRVGREHIAQIIAPRLLTLHNRSFLQRRLRTGAASCLKIARPPAGEGFRRAALRRDEDKGAPSL